MIEAVDLRDKMSLLLKRAKSAAVEASFTCNIEKGYSVSVRRGDIDLIEYHDQRSIVISVYKNHCIGSAMTTQLEVSGLYDCFDRASRLVEFTEPDRMRALPDSSDLAFDYPDLHLHYPSSRVLSDSIQAAKEMESDALGYDACIDSVDSSSFSAYEYHQLLANTTGFMGNVMFSDYSASIGLIAKKGNEKHGGYAYTRSCRDDQMRSHREVALEAAKKAASHLGARQLSSRQCAVLFDPEAAKSLLRVFISAISGRQIYKQSSFLCEAMDQQVFPDFIQIMQRPHQLSMVGSSPFDAEGVYTRDVQYVESGFLRSYCLNSYSARKLDLVTTGNAGGVYNLSIDPTLPHQELLSKMGTGLLVTDLLGQGVDLVSGNYSRGVMGFWVEDGKIQYPVHENTIAANLKDIFLGILAVGDDIDCRGRIQSGSILVERMTVAGG